MIIEENRPEPNEGKVTYTYDHLDRLLYRNVYQGDVPHLRQASQGGYYSGYSDGTGKLAGQRKPKKLLYQDYYTYNNNGLRSVRRIYQPIVEILPAVYDEDPDTYTVTANIICKSPVIASGFIWIETTDAGEGKAKLMYKSMYTNNKFVLDYGSNTFDLNDDVQGIRFTGRNALGAITHTLNVNGNFIKAWTQIETGTLFSKTIFAQDV